MYAVVYFALNEDRITTAKRITEEIRKAGAYRAATSAVMAVATAEQL
jgi:hypothetical protein